MKYARLVAACVGWTILLASTAFAQTRASRLAAPTDAGAGKQVFDSQCAWCHGNDAEGGTGPNLHGRLRHATDDKSIVDIIINGMIRRKNSIASKPDCTSLA